MRIGRLTAVTGVRRRALRYYEEQGLLVAGRSGNGYREYAEDAPVTVGQITALLDSGLNSEAIRRFLPCARGVLPEFDMCDDLRAHLERRLRELDEQRVKLERQLGRISAHLG